MSVSRSLRNFIRLRSPVASQNFGSLTLDFKGSRATNSLAACFTTSASRFHFELPAFTYPSIASHYFLVAADLSVIILSVFEECPAVLFF